MNRPLDMLFGDDDESDVFLLCHPSIYPVPSFHSLPSLLRSRNGIVDVVAGMLFYIQKKHSVNGSYMYYAFKGQGRKDFFIICGTQQRWERKDVRKTREMKDIFSYLVQTFNNFSYTTNSLLFSAKSFFLSEMYDIFGYH